MSNCAHAHHLSSLSQAAAGTGGPVGKPGTHMAPAGGCHGHVTGPTQVRPTRGCPELGLPARHDQQACAKRAR